MKMLSDWAAETRDEWSRGVNWTDESRIEVMLYDDLVDLPFEKIEQHYNEEETDGE